MKFGGHVNSPPTHPLNPIKLPPIKLAKNAYTILGVMVGV